MNAVAAAARVVLAVAFAAAAFAKLRRFSALPAAMRAFGLPPRVAQAAAVVVPFVELALAVTLVVVWSPAWPAWTAAALLVLFTALLVRAAVAHRPCPCFGVLDATPVGPWSVVRNGVLLALAVLATAPH